MRRPSKPYSAAETVASFSEFQRVVEDSISVDRILGHEYTALRYALAYKLEV